jgi:hypothetical protein
MPRKVVYDGSFGHTEEEWAALTSMQRYHFKRREQRIAARKRWGTANAERRKEYVSKSSRKWRLKNIYGLTEADYKTILDFQGGGCAICKTECPGGKLKYFCVDHDHATGKIRGLLCNACNVAIGLLKDSIVLCDNAAAYLKYYSR